MKIKKKVGTKSGAASKAVGYSASMTPQVIPFNHVQLHPKMGYRDVTNLNIPDLANDIGTHGLLNPLVVWNGAESDDKPGKLVSIENKTPVPAALLVAGRRRFEALTSLAASKPKTFAKVFPNGIPVLVKSGSLEDMLVFKVVENVQRENPDPAELVIELSRLRDEFGRSNAEIAKLVGKGKSWVSQIMMVKEELGEEGIEALAKGETTTRGAIAAAATVRKSKKPGSTRKVSAAQALKEAKEKKASNRAEGRERSKKRVSPDGVYQRYSRLAGIKIPVARKLVIAETALAYLAGKAENLPKELTIDSAVTDGDAKSGKGKKGAKKPAAKVAKAEKPAAKKKAVRKAKK